MGFSETKLIPEDTLGGTEGVDGEQAELSAKTAAEIINKPRFLDVIMVTGGC